MDAADNSKERRKCRKEHEARLKKADLDVQRIREEKRAFLEKLLQEKADEWRKATNKQRAEIKKEALGIFKGFLDGVMDLAKRSLQAKAEGTSRGEGMGRTTTDNLLAYRVEKAAVHGVIRDLDLFDPNQVVALGIIGKEITSTTLQHRRFEIQGTVHTMGQEMTLTGEMAISVSAQGGGVVSYLALNGSDLTLGAIDSRQNLLTLNPNEISAISLDPKTGDIEADFQVNWISSAFPRGMIFMSLPVSGNLSASGALNLTAMVNMQKLFSAPEPVLPPMLWARDALAMEPDGAGGLQGEFLIINPGDMPLVVHDIEVDDPRVAVSPTSPRSLPKGQAW